MPCREVVVGDGVENAVSEQVWSAEVYSRNARFVSDLGVGVVEWLDPKPGERILDLGCGDGALTQKIAETGAEVVGADASASFVEATRARGLDARQVDGQALNFSKEFDAIFSNAALHWMTDGEAVIKGVERALKPGGRFVAEFGGHGNVAAIRTALRALADKHGIDDTLADPWFFPTADEYRGMLEAGGFTVDRIEMFHRPTHLPRGLTSWIETFRAPFFDAAGSRADHLMSELEALLSPQLRDRAGQWTADYVRIRFAARLA